MKYDDVDKDLADIVSSAYKTNEHSTTEYVWVRGGGYMHRLVMKRVLGRELKRSEKVDHINGDGTDNRRDNLRICTHQQNMFNQGSRKNTSSKYKGVTFYKRDSNWQSKISPSGKTLHLGYYATEEEAALAYNYAAKYHFGAFVRLNEVHA